MATAWSQQGTDFYPVENTTLTGTLPNHVFKIASHPQKGFWLTKLSEQFSFPHKIYGTERPFIDHAKRSYAGTKGNFGILLNGLQGTGKSVTAKILANELAMPIVLVEANQGKGMIDFLGSIQQDIIVFIDEYEKVFKGEKETDYSDAEEDSTMLTLMDGVMKTAFRKLFLLTTNKVRIHEAMQQRPGRVRYVKHFGNLSKPVIEEIVDDMLLRPDLNLREPTIAFISKLEMITVDIVTSVVSEVNIHQADPETFAAFFNVKKHEPAYNVIGTLSTGEKRTLAYSVHSSIALRNYDEYDNFATKNTAWGRVLEQDDTVEDDEEVKLTILLHDNVKERYDFLKNEKTLDITFEAVPQYHSAFAGDY